MSITSTSAQHVSKKPLFIDIRIARVRDVDLLKKLQILLARNGQSLEIAVRRAWWQTRSSTPVFRATALAPTCLSS
jgi:hypothetical protein